MGVDKTGKPFPVYIYAWERDGKLEHHRRQDYWSKDLGVDHPARHAFRYPWNSSVGELTEVIFKFSTDRILHVRRKE